MKPTKASKYTHYLDNQLKKYKKMKSEMAKNENINEIKMENPAEVISK